MWGNFANIRVKNQILMGLENEMQVKTSNEGNLCKN